MSKREIRVLPSEKVLAEAAAEEFSKQAQEAVDRHGFFSVMLSGGNTPRSMYELLATRKEIPWRLTHVFWGDERMVPPDHPDSNYRMAMDAMLGSVPIPSEQIHRVRTDLEAPAEVADDYTQELSRFARTTEPPRFDLVLLGMGEDGHTASLFPDVPTPIEELWVIAPWVPHLQMNRVSVTPRVFNFSERVMFLISDRKKAKTLQAVLEGPVDPARYPIQRICPTRGTAIWMLDEPAASLLLKRSAA
jgi:6-phosphogluconolactonase